MAGNVIKKLIGQCRKALLGGIPILYIKTESSILIRDILENRDDPLVVPISSSTSDHYSNRPISEWIRDGKDYRKREYNIFDNQLPDPKPQLMYPCLWAYKMPEQLDHTVIAKLEKYVMAHEDPDHKAYDILQSSVVLLYGSTVQLSAMLRPYVEIIEVAYPDEAEIRDIIITESGAASVLTENESYLNRLCTLFMGFSTEEIVTTMQKIMALVPLEDSAKVEAQIFARKKQKLEGGLLEFVSDKGYIGGMRRYRQWLDEQIEPLKDANTYKRKVGTLPPKGVLLCGIPGCGKSEAAKFTANKLDLPLLKMDVGSLMDKWQGNSEQRMRDALHLAEAMAPCVLWIDELEKGFSGAGGNSDNGSFKRMFGYMLGWMQDVKVPCFIFATANNIGGLPKEFFRSGRFDALYAVYLPTAEECVSIFKSSMDRAIGNIARAKDQKKEDVTLFTPGCFQDALLFDIIDKHLVNRDGTPRIVIGADIQKVVNVALRRLIQERCIDEAAWVNALAAALDTCSVYGDGEENVDSIAVSYCRMLRKNFIPTADVVLFDSRNYVISNRTEYEKLLRVPTAGMSEEELRQHEEKLRNSEILQEQTIPSYHAYDRAVYSYLHKRINQLAVLLEQHENRMLITG